MKKTVYTFLILSITVLNIYAQQGWFWLNPLPQGNYLSGITFTENNTGYLIGSNGTLLKSTNNGIEWVQTSLGNLYTISVATNDNYVYTSVYDFCNNSSGVYRSTDNGVSWIQTSFNERLIPALAVIENYVFAGTWGCVYPGGVYVSSDNGINWSNTPLTNPDVESICINENRIYAGLVFNGNSAGGVYHSSDFGATWSFLGLSNRSIMSIAVSNDRIYAGTLTSGIFVTTNNGANWTQTSLNNQRVLSIVINGENVLAGTLSGGVYLSRDNGLNWIQKNEGLDTLYIQSLLISNDYIFAGSMGKGVYRRSLSEIVNVKQTSEILPSEHSLRQNYPNPFNPVTNISFDIAVTGNTKLIVFDVSGKIIAELVNEILSPGTYLYSFHTSSLPSGVYFYKLEVGNYIQTRRMVLVK